MSTTTKDDFDQDYEEVQSDHPVYVSILSDGTEIRSSSAEEAERRVDEALDRQRYDDDDGFDISYPDEE